MVGPVGAASPVRRRSRFADKTAPDQETSNYIVRAYDAAGHFVDSDAVAVLVDSTAQSAPQSLTAATPTSARARAHLAGSAASSPSTTTTSTATDCCSPRRRARRRRSRTRPRPRARTTTPSSPATPASQPGVLSISFKVVLDKTAPTSGGAPTAQVLAGGQVKLAWPAAGDALSGVAGYVVRRVAGGTPPAAADGGTAVCAPAQPGCTDAAAGDRHLVVRRLRPRRAPATSRSIGTVSNVVVVDKTPPLAPTKLTVTRAEGQEGEATSITFTLHWVKPTAADLDRVVVVLNLKRAPDDARPTARPSTRASAPRPRSSCARGRTATSRSTPTTTAATYSHEAVRAKVSGWRR